MFRLVIDEQEATLGAQNEAISKSGRLKSTFKEFVHGQYVALPLPAGRGANLQGMRIAKLMDDGGWMLGRIKTCKRKKMHSITGERAGDPKYRYTVTWTSSNTTALLEKTKFWDSQYGRHWVLFDKKP
mgnify:FL=1